MDPRTAGSVLIQIASFLELRGESPFKVRAYAHAARALAELDTDDLGAFDAAGKLAEVRGLGPATLSVVRDLVASGESQFLEDLKANTPEGLIQLLEIPGLGTSRIHQLHSELGIDSVDALEAAARDGRITRLKGYGPKTTEKLLKGIELYRSSGSRVLYHRGLASSRALLAMIRSHPDVMHAEIAGSVRRHLETVGDSDVVAACAADPVVVAGSIERLAGVKSVVRPDTASPGITFADGARLDLCCVREHEYVVALWRATGSAEHVAWVAHVLEARGIVLRGDTLVDASGRTVTAEDERAIYVLAGLPFFPPEMREKENEALSSIPQLIEVGDVRGALHSHTTYSDGKQGIEAMALAARDFGWSYIGITDHSQGAFYAGGLSRERVLAQVDEIDRLNAGMRDFRILKGIECDILADGALDYDAALLDRLDFVVGSVHSRFTMDRETMTARVLRALDDPHLTILGHPTGRLLLSRRPAAMDVDAVLRRAVANGVAIELNCDTKRMDIDWRHIPSIVAAGGLIAIGPDAHSSRTLDNVAFGVGAARKAGVRAADVLNARDADGVLAFAAARRARPVTSASSH